MVSRNRNIICTMGLFVMVFSLCMGQMLEKPLKDMTYCLDAGEGGEMYSGEDRTALVTDKLQRMEREANLRIAFFLRSYLEDAGAEVILTRKTHTPPFPGLKERAEISAPHNPDLFIGIHHNYSRDKSVNYITAYVNQVSLQEPISNMLTQMAGELGTSYRYLDTGKRPLFDYVVSPAVIISVGFITNKKCRKAADDLEENHRIAIALFKAILDMEQKKERIEIGEPTPVLKPIKVPTPTPSLYESPFELEAPEPAPQETVLPPSLPGLKPIRPAEPIRPLPESPLLLPEATPPTPVLKPLTEIATPTPFTPVVPLETKVEIRDEPSEEFIPPFLNPVNGHIDQTWLYGESWGEWPVKKGISFRVDSGTPVCAVANGKVIEADDSGKAGSLSSYPNYVLIEHDEKLNGDNVYTLYAQLASIKVAKGDQVEAGDEIGVTGASYADAQSRDNELEFEVRIGGETGDFVRNPELYIEHVGDSVGYILGHIAEPDGDPIPGLRLTGVSKPDYCQSYQFSMTYGKGVNSTDAWNENFAICDVIPGTYGLTTIYGLREIVVKPGMITFVDWGTE